MGVKKGVPSGQGVQPPDGTPSLGGGTCSEDVTPAWRCTRLGMPHLLGDESICPEDEGCSPVGIFSMG